MKLNSFNIFLSNLGFTKNDLSNTKVGEFVYNIGLNEDIHYVYAPTSEHIFEKHQYFWNKNNTNIFIVISENNTYIIHSKQKPNPENPIAKNIVLKTFEYGVNTQGFEKENIKEISKEYIDSAYFFDFISKQIINKKKQEVDKDLLLNLIALRNDLLAIKNDEDTIHILILRSLFIKYLEDKGIYDNNYWKNILYKQEPELVLKAFNEIKRINGDIFDEQLIANKIEPEYLPKLYKFFNSDYRTGQTSIFPYRFDYIPIQLISHVYEAFLKSKEKKGKGIYYTPTFVVNFMLSQSLHEILKKNPNSTVLDPAVGSGAFLVESFRAIMQKQPQPVNYEKKKHILENQLFGIDIDRKALQIATFSLYLALIETEKPDFIREQIENSHPILPSLIDKTLVCANAITDDIFTNKTFDCIVSNPPWGSAEPNGDEENDKERIAIGTKGKIGTIPEYKNVANFERSQAFLVRIKNWCTENTIFALIVKNSIFLNDNSEDFRKELLKTYQINYFYELSNYNKILFKKQIIGEINGKTIEIGATEPCAILIFELPKIENNILKYISPKLNDFSECFQLIHFTQKDINAVEQNRFIEDDLLWRVLVNGDFESFKLINKIKSHKEELDIICSKGFEPQKNTMAGEVHLRKMIKSEHFNRWIINSNFIDFNWSQELRRKGNENLFEGERILIANRPTPNDSLKLRSILVSQDLLFRNDIIGFKVKNSDNHLPYLCILNSQLIGYFIFQISAQWFAGLKRDYIRVDDIKSLPLTTFHNYTDEIKRIFEDYFSKDIKSFENQIDELIFNLYNLTTYQKEIIREFYQIRVERAENKLKYVQAKDIESYIEEFAKTFNLIIKKGRKLVGLKYKISANIGAVVCFTIVDENETTKTEEDKSLEILHFVKNKQIQQVDISKILNEEKVKIYDNEFMYIVKSNLFKDWTVRQAIKDAKEELGLLMSKLPEK